MLSIVPSYKEQFLSYFGRGAKLQVYHVLCIPNLYIIGKYSQCVIDL